MVYFLFNALWFGDCCCDREDVESDLRFLGLLVMQNKLKPETKPVILELKQAAIRCVMVTGDNIDTAISVARECELICPGQRVIQVDASVNEADQRLNVVYRPVTDSRMLLSTSLSASVDTEVSLVYVVIGSGLCIGKIQQTGKTE